MVNKTTHYIVILCGGTGPRLWPLSRVDHPKQFLKIFTDNSLLKETVLRAQKIVPPENIYIITNKKYQNLIQKDLKTLVKSRNIIGEPQKKNTAMAILYATAIISNLNPEAVISTFPADHFIGSNTNFTKDIKRAASIASSNSIVTIGIKPTSPSPSFGYITVDSKNKVSKFTEKPTVNEAQKLITKKNCYWNSGIYTFSIKNLINEFHLYAKEYLPLYTQLQENLNHQRVIDKIYSLSPTLPIDVAISEKSKNFVLIPATFYWNDIGEWKSIYQELPKKENQIAPLSKDVQYVEIGSKNCLVSANSKKLVGLIDVNNLAIIDSPDALLICNIAKDGSFRVRDLITKIVQNPKIKHFFTGKND